MPTMLSRNSMTREGIIGIETSLVHDTKEFRYMRTQSKMGSSAWNELEQPGPDLQGNTARERLCSNPQIPKHSSNWQILGGVCEVNFDPTS